MQRFKDFTKKSGKVASAILSAAMVTSMVAGTNVVYAANTEVQAEATDVKANNYTKADVAADCLTSELKKLPISSLQQFSTSLTASTATGTSLKTDAAFTKAEEAAYKQLLKEEKTAEAGLVTGSAFDITLKDKVVEPTKAEDGSVTLSVVVTNGAVNVTREVKYTLASINERTKVTKAEIEKYIKNELVVTETNKDKVADEIQKYLNKQETNGVKKFADVTVTTPAATTLSADEKTVTGTVEFTVTGGDATKVDFSKSVKEDSAVVEEAADAIDAYLGNVKYFDKDIDLDQVATVINKVIADNYADYVETVTTDSAIEVKCDNPAGKDNDSTAEITYTLVSKADSDKKITKTTKVKVPSTTTKLNQMMDDMKAVAAEVSATKDTKTVDFYEAYDNAYAEKVKDITVTESNSIGESVYGESAKVVREFVPATDTSAPMVVLTAKYGDEEKKDSYVYGEEQEAPKGQFVEKDGKKFYYDENGQLLQNTFLQGTESPDGYTYYIQNDGSVMQDRLTYYPNSADVIYFDKDGHEVFDAFVNVKKDIQGNAVDYIGYFNTSGKAYTNVTTYGNGEGAYAKDALFYINDYGVLENKGWFKNAAGEIGYAAPNGTLTTSQWSLDQFGRKVYFQANGFLAKGLMTDGVKYYQLDETDGHLVGEF